MTSHRRSFLKTATLGALGGAYALRAASSSTAGPKNVEDKPGVQLAIASICCDGFGNENFEPTFRIAPAAGFRNIEFNCWYPNTLTPAGLRSIVKRCRERGVRPISVQGNAFADGGAADVGHKLWCMEAARQLGCSRVKFTGSKRGAQGGLKTLIASVKELAPAAEEMGMLLCLENHVNNTMENLADYEEIFAAIDSPNVGLCLDSGHFIGAGVKLDSVVERFHHRVNHVDLKDCKAFGTYKTVRFGEGVADLHSMTRTLIERGYQGYLVVEQAPPIEADTLEADIAHAYQLFQRYERPRSA